jgi:hypothetical protein
MMNIFKKEELRETSFSRFIRKADSAEKKKVFKTVLRKATEDQRKILEKV